MAEPKLLKVYFWHTRQDGECTPSEEDLKQAIDQQNLKGYVCGVFSEVPADRSDINDYNAMTTTKQFFSTKVHAVYEGGHTLDVWTDLNSDGDKCWWGYSDYGDLQGMLGDYAYELPPIESGT